MSNNPPGQGCYPGCFYYTDSCFRKDCMHSVPAHKQLDPAKKPGQVISFPLRAQPNEDMMDDMGQYADVPRGTVTGRCASTATYITEAAKTETAARYKPAHGGYPE